MPDKSDYRTLRSSGDFKFPVTPFIGSYRISCNNFPVADNTQITKNLPS